MTHSQRRKILIDRMQELESSGLNCQNCQGNCCTYEANSMMVSPVEAFELAESLKAKNEFDEELKKKLQDTVVKYRLDSSLGNGKRSFIRRTYTCPFFNHKELGCPLPRDIKPYGCLAFNAHDKELKAGEHCFSEKDVLERRENEFSEEKKLNQEIKEKYSLAWDKTPLPLALLDFFRIHAVDPESH